MSDGIGHRRAWELIPWVVNGRASDDERSLVDEHVRECADCRSELAFQQELQQGMLEAPEPALDANAGLEQLWKRIDAGESAQPIAARSSTLIRWLAVAVVVEAVGLTVLSTDALFSARNAPYQTLTSGSTIGGRASLRAVFAPQVSQAELQALLQKNALQIVAGPSESGAYALMTTPDSNVTAALRSLRADPRVLFAEPLQ